MEMVMTRLARILRVAVPSVLLTAGGAWAAGTATPLTDAVKANDVKAVRTQLQKPAAVRETSADGSTPLHYAVEANAAEIAAALLKAGASPQAANRYGVKPLSLAAVNGSVEMIGLRLKAGADPNTALPEGETALMTAARAGNPKAVQALIEAGADVNARTASRGQTALMWAAARDNADAVRILLQHGAKIDARTENPARVSGRASESGNTFTATQPTGFTPFLFAVRAGSLNAVKALVESGADVNDTLSDGESALVVAAANAHWEVADYLLDKGADPNRAGAGWNALHQAVRERRPNIGFGTPGPIPTGTIDSINVIAKMLAKGAKVNARMTKNGMKDGQRNRLNRLGATAFFLAAKNTDTEVMKLLAKAGADAKIPSADGTTAAMVASGLFLWNPGEDGGSLPGQEDEVIEAVKICLDMGVDVNATNQYGETALHGAAYRGVPALAEFLVERGAKLDAKDERGWTPLAVANGLSYSDFYKEQLTTAAALKKMMTARGLSIEGQRIDSKVCLDCLQTRIDQAREVIERDVRMEAEFAKQEGGAGSK
jgi:ankyrin repeat protein